MRYFCTVCGKEIPKILVKERGNKVSIYPSFCACAQHPKLGECPDLVPIGSGHILTDKDIELHKAMMPLVAGSLCPCCWTIGNVISVDEMLDGGIDRGPGSYCTCCNFHFVQDDDGTIVTQ